MLVDKIDDVVAVEQTLIEKAPATLSEALRRLCKGIIRRKENLLIVLDVEKILDPETIFNTPTTTRKRRKVDHYKQVDKKIAFKVENRKPEANDSDSVESERAAPNKSTSDSGARSIFDRIGGEIGVHGAVSLLSNRLLEDPQLENSVSASNIEQVIATFVGLLTKRLGGPHASYVGNSIEDALADLQISRAQLNDIVHHLRSALEVMEMPADLVEEVLTAL